MKISSVFPSCVRGVSSSFGVFYSTLGGGGALVIFARNLQLLVFASIDMAAEKKP